MPAPLPPIIYEDDNLIVINKPSGLLTHPVTPDVPVESALGLFPGSYLIHRLDRETSGVLLLAKNLATQAHWRAAWQERQVRKTYLAFVSGQVKKDGGLITLPIGRSQKDPRRRVAGPRAHGQLRPAITHWRLLQKFTHHSYLELKPETGRTHQLRAHLKAIGYPIVSDKIYNHLGDTLPTLPRLGLHATELVWQNFHFTAPPPNDFMATLEYLKNLC